MSLVTTCPACNTTFRVKPEHLAAHRGDVRCGSCNHVFNALEQLAEAVPSVSPAPSEHVESQASPPPAGDEVTAALPDAASLEIDFVLEAEPEPPAEPIDSTDQAPAASSYPSLIDPDLAVEQPAAAQESESESESESQPPAKAEPRRIHPAAASPRQVPPSRTPSEKRPVRWTSWLLGVLVLLLLLGAVGQSAYFLRTEIATRFPQAKPWLTQGCAALDCSVELPRQIDLVSIDDSDLREDAEHENVVLLTSTLVNHARFAQAYPHLELTLTDLDDRAILRRSFAPQEYLPQGADVASGMPADGEVHVKLALSPGEIKAAGYRVYIAYP